MNWIQQEQRFLRDWDMQMARRDTGYYNPEDRKPFASFAAREQAKERAEDCPESPSWPGQHSTQPPPEGAVLTIGEEEDELEWLRRTR